MDRTSSWTLKALGGVMVALALGIAGAAGWLALRARAPSAAVGAATTPFASIAVRDAQGALTREGALAAFAAAFGGMPGVTVPPRVRGVPPCGTEIIGRVTADFATLTPAQQDRVRQVLGLLPRAPSTSAQILRVEGASAPAARVARVRRILDAARAIIERRTGHHLTDEVVVNLVDEAVPSADEPRVMAFTLPAPDDAVTACVRRDYCYNLRYKTDTPAPLNACFLFVGAALDRVDEGDATSMLAHELFHCYQFDATSRAPAAGGGWRAEGSAAFVGERIAEQLAPGSAIGYYVDWWSNWIAGMTLRGVGTPLGGYAHYNGDYGSIALFMQLDRAGALRWAQLLDLALYSNHDGFAALTAGHSRLLGGLAAGALRRRAWGPGWYFDASARIPELPEAHRLPAPTPSHVTLQQGATQVTLEATEHLWDHDFAPDVEVVRVRADGGPQGAMIVPGQPDTALFFDAPRAVVLCRRPAGCACPSGNTPPDGPPAATVRDPTAHLYIAAMGPATTQGRFEVQGLTLEAWCREERDAGPPDDASADASAPDAAPITGHDPCLTGTWHIDRALERANMAASFPATIRVTGVRGDLRLWFDGRGGGGSEFAQYCVETQVSGAMPMTQKVIFDGRGAGRYTAAGGTLATSDYQPAGLSVRAEVTVAGQRVNVPVPDSQALATAALPGTTRYRCSASELTFDGPTRRTRYTR